MPEHDRCGAAGTPANLLVDAKKDSGGAICPPRPGVTAGGKDTGISLQVDDIEDYHAHLKDRGANVDAEISRFGDAVPPLFWFRDPADNKLMAVEAR
jgi:predicted enzyme related to lactoylglutathione lyase